MLARGIDVTGLLDQVTPRTVINNALNARARHFELPGQLKLVQFVGGIECTYLFDLFAGQYCAITFLAALISLRWLDKHMAMLLHHIVRVVLRCASEQVGRIATWPIVALMQHPQFIRYRPVSDNPSRTRSIHALAANAEYAAACRAHASRERPTFIGTPFVHLRPEPCLEARPRVALAFIGAKPATKAATAIFDCAYRNVKLFAAYFADAVGDVTLRGHWKLILSSVGHTLLKQCVAVCVVGPF